MKIYIPTRARLDRQATAYLMRMSSVPYTIVCPSGETGHHDEDVLWTPPYIKGIKETRNWILDFHQKTHPNDPKLVMFDDDLNIYLRTEDGSKFHKTMLVQDLVFTLDAMLSDYAHGGVSEKFMSQTKPRNFIRNSRYYHILAYNLSRFPNPQPRARVEVGEDHDMNLQLMIAGLPNFVLTEWANSDRPYAPGGCSTWRNPTVELVEGKKLQALFPRIVYVVELPDRPCKLRIYWKDAAKLGGLK